MRHSPIHDLNEDLQGLLASLLLELDQVQVAQVGVVLHAVQVHLHHQREAQRQLAALLDHRRAAPEGPEGDCVCGACGTCGTGRMEGIVRLEGVVKLEGIRRMEGVVRLEGIDRMVGINRKVGIVRLEGNALCLQFEIGAGAEDQNLDGLIPTVANLLGMPRFLSHSQRGRFAERVLSGGFFDLQHEEGVSHRFSLLVHHVELLRLLVDAEAEGNEAVLQVREQQAETQILGGNGVALKIAAASVISLQGGRFVRFLLKPVHGDGEELRGVGGKHPTSNAELPRPHQFRLLIGLEVHKVDRDVIVVQVEQNHRQVDIPAVRQTKHLTLRTAILVEGVRLDLNILVEW